MYAVVGLNYLDRLLNFCQISDAQMLPPSSRQSSRFRNWFEINVTVQPFSQLGYLCLDFSPVKA